MGAVTFREERSVADGRERDFDREFDELVASLREPQTDTSAGDVESTPAPEQPVVNPPIDLSGIGVWRTAVGSPADETYLREVADTGSSQDDPGDEAPFVPPPVRLPPQEDLHFWGIVVLLVAGPVLVLWTVLTGGTGSWLGLTGLAATVGGFALLVLRQPRERDRYDDGTRI